VVHNGSHDNLPTLHAPRGRAHQNGAKMTWSLITAVLFAIAGGAVIVIAVGAMDGARDNAVYQPLRTGLTPKEQRRLQKSGEAKIARPDPGDRWLGPPSAKANKHSLNLYGTKPWREKERRLRQGQ
jgi:hypothetical protein